MSVDTLNTVKVNITDANGEVVLNGVASHVYTILSITLCETAGNDETFSIVSTTANSSDGSLNSPFYIYHTQSLPAKATFEHTSKLVLEGTDELWVTAGGDCDIDVVVSYLDQDSS